MSISVKSIRSEIKASKRNRGANGKERRDQTLYFAKRPDGSYVVSRDRETVNAQRDKNSAIRDCGSRASLPPMVIDDTWERCGNLADTFLALGGEFGARSQNEDAAERIAKYVIEAKDTLTSLAKHHGMKPPKQLRDDEELPPGEWMTKKVVTYTQDDLDYLRSLAGENGEATNAAE